MPLSDVVNVIIDRETASVAQDSFDIIALMSSEVNSHNKVEFASSLSGVKDLLIGGSGGEAYRIAQAIFSQNPCPKRVALIPIKSVIACVYSGDLAENDKISLIVNGTKYTETYDTSTAATLTALAEAINAGLSGAGASAASGVFLFDSTSAVSKLSVKVDLSEVASTSTFLMHVSRFVDITFSGTWTAAGSVALKINGTTITQAFSTSLDNSMSALAEALEAGVSAVSLAAWTDASTRLTIYAKANNEIRVEGVTISGVTGTLDYVSAGHRVDDDSVTDILDAARQENNSWYGLIYVPYITYDSIAEAAVSTEIANIKAIADWTEANRKLCGIFTDEPNSIDQTVTADTTTLAAYVKSKGYARSFVVHTPNASMCSVNGVEAPNAAILAKVFPWTPGSYTCKFKKLAGVTPTTYTDTQAINADAKSLNTYVSMGGQSMFQQGKVGEGEWIDTIIFCDWIRSLIETNVFSALVNAKKVPFDDVGISVIGSQIEAALEAGVSSGGFTRHLRDADGNVIGGFVVTLPKASEISDNDKNNRTISSTNPIEFIGYLSGAIHAVTIQGKVRV